MTKYNSGLSLHTSTSVFLIYKGLLNVTHLGKTDYGDKFLGHHVRLQHPNALNAAKSSIVQ